MVIIYKPNEVPKWIKNNCIGERKSNTGINYTTYTGYGEKILYYIVHTKVKYSIICHLLQEKEQQEYRQKQKYFSSEYDILADKIANKAIEPTKYVYELHTLDEQIKPLKTFIKAILIIISIFIIAFIAVKLFFYIFAS